MIDKNVVRNQDTLEIITWDQGCLRYLLIFPSSSVIEYLKLFIPLIQEYEEYSKLKLETLLNENGISVALMVDEEISLEQLQKILSNKHFPLSLKLLSRIIIS